MSLVNLFFYGSIGDLLIAAIVVLILFPMYVYHVRHEAVPHYGKLVWSGISLLVPVPCVIAVLIMGTSTMQSRYSHLLGPLYESHLLGPLYELLVIIFESFMVINAIILFNIFRRVVTDKFGLVTVLYGILTIVGTLLGMASFMGLAWVMTLY